ncbi:MAG: hypothetical protein ACKO6N_27130 [Myxococcota bacterium]
MSKAPRTSLICAALSIGLSIQPALAGIPTHLEPAQASPTSVLTSQGSPMGSSWAQVQVKNGRIGTHLPPTMQENGRIGTHLPPTMQENGRHNPNDGDQDHSEPIDYRFTFEVTRMELGPEGLPCLVEVEGAVLKRNGNQKPIGQFEAAFYDCPTYQPLPDELANNIFGIPAGTVMPAWDGTVTYFLKKGTLFT